MVAKSEREDGVGLVCPGRGSRTSCQRVFRNRPEMQRSTEEEELERMLQGSACEDRDMRAKGPRESSSPLLPGRGLAEEREA